MSRTMSIALVATVVLLITLFVLLMGESKLKSIYLSSVSKQSCKASVQESSKFLLRYSEFATKLNCPTITLKIHDKDSEIIKKKIADSMADCWDNFGRGKLDLFADDNVYCTICHRITFDKGLKFKGLTDYIATKNAPGQDITYLQFLTTERTENSEFLKDKESKQVDDTIDASMENQYAVVFTYIKGKKFMQERLAEAKYVAPGLGIFAIGFGVFKLGGVIAGATSITGVGTAVGGTVATAGVLVMAVGTLWEYVTVYLASQSNDVPFEHIASVSFIPYNAQSLINLNCKETPISQK